MKRACLQSLCSWSAAALLFLAAPTAFGQITSSPNVVGSGARALGMGGAFIALADDATSASWNPGGLTQLERPEFSAVYNFNFFSEDFQSGSHPELDGSHDVNFDQLNYLSFVYPFRRTIGGRNLVFSLNYQRKYDFDRNLKLNYNTFFPVGPIAAGSMSRIDYSQRGSLGTFSPAFGFELTDRLSLGVVWNIWDSSIVPGNEWKERQVQETRTYVAGVPFTWTKSYMEFDYENFEGNNFTFGALYRVNERWTVGAVYHTKFTADIDFTTRQRLPLIGGFMERTRGIEYVFPSAFGVGVAYRFPNDKLTLSMDITRREWDQFVVHDPDNPVLSMQRRSAVTQLPKSQSPHDPTYTVRIGGEYVFVDESKPRQDYLPSLRAGLFYDPEPSGGRREEWFGLGKGDGSVEDYYGFSLGLGLLIKNRVNLDLAYVYRWGNDVRKDTFGQFGLSHTDADVDQHLIYLSTVIYF